MYKKKWSWVRGNKNNNFGPNIEFKDYKSTKNLIKIITCFEDIKIINITLFMYYELLLFVHTLVMENYLLPIFRSK